MKLLEKIKELIKKSDVQTNPGTDERILADALQQLEKLKQQKSAETRPNVWRTIMEAKVSRLAAAIFIAFGIGFSTGRWSKPAQLAPHTLDITAYTSITPVYPTAQKAEDSFWRQKALAATQPGPYAQIPTTKTSLFNTYKQYLKEKTL